MPLPYRKPRLFIQLSGAPGSGKSSLAKRLRPSFSAVIVDHDVLRSSLFDDSEASFDSVAKQAYSLQWALAEDLMKQGHNIIIDSTCNYQTVLDVGTSLATKYGYIYWYVECHVDDIGLLDERLRSRAPLKSQRPSVYLEPEAAQIRPNGNDTRTPFENWMKNPCRPLNSPNVIILDGTSSLGEQLNACLENILNPSI